MCMNFLMNNFTKPCVSSAISCYQGVGSGRAKRYSSQRQRAVPEPAPMHIGVMEGHFYEPSECSTAFAQ